MTTSIQLGPGAAPTKRRLRGPRSTLDRPAGLALGIAVLWFSLLVMIPLALVVLHINTAPDRSAWDTFWTTLTNRRAANAIQLTLLAALVATIVNIVIGTLIAWVLVRDANFIGRRFVELLVDVPFALPSLVAGLVLLSLYGDAQSSPIGVGVRGTQYSVFLAILFVTLPFVVRTVQPVLIELDTEVEQAAASLGASRFTVFRRIILPSLTPAIAAGATLSFARGVGEYGALVLLTGNRPNVSEGASVLIVGFVETNHPAAAASVAVFLLMIALLAIITLDLIARRVARNA